MAVPGVELRRQVWPYLLEHYRFDMSAAERDEKDRVTRMRYEDAISEWCGLVTLRCSIPFHLLST